jgi:sulfur-carrier protein
VPRVNLIASLSSQFTGGLDRIDVEADDVRQLLGELNQRFPGFGDHIDKHMAIIIDGAALRGWTAPLKPESEIYLVPRIAGGLRARHRLR